MHCIHVAKRHGHGWMILKLLTSHFNTVTIKTCQLIPNMGGINRRVGDRDNGKLCAPENA